MSVRKEEKHGNENHKFLSVLILLKSTYLTYTSKIKKSRRKKIK